MPLAPEIRGEHGAPAADRLHGPVGGGGPVVKMDASGAVAEVSVFAPDGLVARSQGGSWTQYAFDPQGSVSQRLSGTGTVLSNSVYDAYGVETNSGGTPTDPFGFNARDGYLLDRETGLCLCGHRYYDPGAGRWLTRDPIGAAGGINVYAYCGAAPSRALEQASATSLASSSPPSLRRAERS